MESVIKASLIIEQSRKLPTYLKRVSLLGGWAALKSWWRTWEKQGGSPVIPWAMAVQVYCSSSQVKVYIGLGGPMECWKVWTDSRWFTASDKKGFGFGHTWKWGISVLLQLSSPGQMAIQHMRFPDWPERCAEGLAGGLSSPAWSGRLL